MCQMNKLWICGEVGDAALPELVWGRVGSPKPMSGVPYQSEELEMMAVLCVPFALGLLRKLGCKFILNRRSNDDDEGV